MGSGLAHVVSHIGFHFSRDLDDLDRVRDRYHIPLDQPVHEALNQQKSGLTVRIGSVGGMPLTIIV